MLVVMFELKSFFIDFVYDENFDLGNFCFFKEYYIEIVRIV